MISLLARYEKSFRQALLVFAFFMAATLQSLHPQVLTDPDLWWHLRTGQWIVEHRELPQTDPFSLYGQGRPWVAYSWLFELLLFGLYRLFGLAGPVFFTAGMWLAIAALLLAYLRLHVL